MSAHSLRDAVTLAREQGASWSAIGRALGRNRETIYRQYTAGSPVVVIQPHQKKPAA
jgi:Homeodomain-like domain